MNLNTLGIVGAAAAVITALGSCAHYKNTAAELRVQLVASQTHEQVCRATVQALEEEAQAREAAAKKALAAAQGEANRHAQRADRLLRQPAAVPGDDCASARVRARKWLEARQ